MGHLIQLKSGPATGRHSISVCPARTKCDDETLTHLIGHIYDAALDPELWTDVLASIGEFVGGQGGGLLSKDTISKCGTPYYHFGVDPHHVQLYSETHSKFDPVTTLPYFDVEQIVSIPELVPYDEFRRERFFQEWMQPQGWADAANSVLEKSASSFSFLTILRSEECGLVDDEMRRRLALVVPHLRRAVLIGKVINLKQAEAATYAGVLDGLSAGLLLVDAKGRIVHANTAGRDMLDAGDCLRSIGGRLVGGNMQAKETFRDIFAAAGNGDAEIGARGIAVSLTASDGELYVAHVLPLTSGARQHIGVAYTAAAAVFVRKAAMESPSIPEVIGRSYKLTPTELRVLLALVEVGSISEVAETLGIADTTVKTHLGRLFEKTGAGRQAELIKLVAGFASPLSM